MKKILLLFAAAAAFASCQKNDIRIPEKEDVKMHKIDFTAAFEKTKTSIVADGEGNYDFTWNAGDQVRIWEMVDGGEMASVTATINTAGSLAEFSCNFTARAADEFKYLALYPYQYDVSQTFKDITGKDRFRIKLPEQQLMYKGSFDANSDLLVSKLVTSATQPQKIDLQFGRIGSILQLCVKGLDTSIPVTSIKFTSDCILAGFVEFNPETCEYSLDKGMLAQRDKYDNPISFPYVWLNKDYDPSKEAPAFESDSITFWFRTFPAEIKEFTIEVQQSSGRGPVTNTFRRYNVLSRSGAGAVRLQDGKMTKLTLNIGNAVAAESVAISGEPAKAMTGNTYQLSCTLTPLNASEKVSWTSSDPTKARIDNYGLLTAYSAGEVTITCQAGGVSDSLVLVIEETIPETVDLDLPSGTLWSSCNLGANSPEASGLYFSWGDPINSKSKCSRSYYKFWNYYGEYHDNYLSALMGKYCLDGAYSDSGQPDGKRFLDPEDDPVAAHLGEGWRSPTNAEFEELKANCDMSRESVNGINCIRFTSRNNGASIVLPLAGWDTGSRAGELARFWTCEQTPNWYELDSNLEEYGGVVTDITQTNKKTWAGLTNSKHSTGNIWGSAFVLDPTGDEIKFSQKYFERYMYVYTIRPVKAARPPVTIPVHITSVENLSTTSARVNVEFADEEYNKNGVVTTHTYYFGWTKEGVTTLPSEQGTTTRTTPTTLSYTITGLTAGKEYVVYAHYQRKAGSDAAEHFYSDNRVRFTAQADPTKALQSVAFSPSELILDVGDKYQLVPVLTPSTAEVTSINYQTSNPSVITVNETGQITAVGKGKAFVYCTVVGVNGQRNATCYITVPDRLNYGNDGSAGEDIIDIINGGNW